MPSPQPLLHVHNLTFTRPGQARPTLENLSFSAERGQILCLLGHSGAGKTSLCEVIAGWNTPERGTIRFSPAGATVSLIHSVHLDPARTPGEILEETAGRRGAALAQGLGLEDWRDQPLAALPHGIRQRVELANALLSPADILLADDLAGLDGFTAGLLRTCLPDAIHAGEKLLILTTRLPEVAAALSDRVLALRSGRLALDLRLPLPSHTTQPWPYRIHLRGGLDPSRADWLAGLDVHPIDGETVLTGLIPDQAALYGLLLRLRDLGMEILSIQRQAPTIEETLKEAMG